MKNSVIQARHRSPQRTLPRVESAAAQKTHGRWKSFVITSDWRSPPGPGTKHFAGIAITNSFPMRGRRCNRSRQRPPDTPGEDTRPPKSTPNNNIEGKRFEVRHVLPEPKRESISSYLGHHHRKEPLSTQLETFPENRSRRPLPKKIRYGPRVRRRREAVVEPPSPENQNRETPRVDVRRRL
ncbi:Uncharacterized protein Rs2_17194 [Raphanus sativus]|nr:Uncharacterized protein Rs2_17194 [Raphanus sativus]